MTHDSFSRVPPFEKVKAYEHRVVRAVMYLVQHPYAALGVVALWGQVRFVVLVTDAREQPDVLRTRMYQPGPTRCTCPMTALRWRVPQQSRSHWIPACPMLPLTK